MTNSVVLILGGAFSPIHNGHISAINTAKTHLESQSITVLDSYLAIAPYNTIRHKYASTGGDILTSHRAKMCEIAAKDFCIKIISREYPSFSSLCRDVISRYPSGTKIVEVRGSDRAAHSKINRVVIEREGYSSDTNGAISSSSTIINVSATKIRKALCIGCWYRHSAECDMKRDFSKVSEMLHKDVIGYLKANPNAIPISRD